MEISPDDIPLVIRALENYADYLTATNRDDRPYRAIADSLKKKPVASETAKEQRVQRRKGKM